MSAWPKTREELRDQKYEYDGNAICRGKGCGMRIQWWYTPKGRRIPLTPPPVRGIAEILEPHWASCPDAQSFRRKKDK